MVLENPNNVTPHDFEVSKAMLRCLTNHQALEAKGYLEDLLSVMADDPTEVMLTGLRVTLAEGRLNSDLFKGIVIGVSLALASARQEEHSIANFLKYTKEKKANVHDIGEALRKKAP